MDATAEPVVDDTYSSGACELVSCDNVVFKFGLDELDPASPLYVAYSRGPSRISFAGNANTRATAAAVRLWLDVKTGRKTAAEVAGEAARGDAQAAQDLRVFLSLNDAPLAALIKQA